jgi:hypothetical protein
LDKVTATADILQHEGEDFSLLGLGHNGFQDFLVACEIKRIVHALG